MRTIISALLLAVALPCFGQYEFDDLPFMAQSLRSGGAPGDAPFSYGMAIWYRAQDYAATNANGTEITFWNDKSGNGYHATNKSGFSPVLTNSVINGKSAMKFENIVDSDRLYAYGGTITNSAMAEIFAVVRSHHHPSQFGGIWRISGDNPVGWSAHPYENGKIYEKFAAKVSSVPWPIPWGQYASNWHIYHVSVSSNAMVMRYNGELIGGSDIVTPGINLPVNLGYNGVVEFRGEIAEVLIYTNCMSCSNSEATYQYLANQYAIPTTNATQTYHPTSFPGLVGWWDASTLTGSDGDSITNLPDLSGNGLHWTNRLANVPVLASSVFNGNNALFFNRADGETLTLAATPLTLVNFTLVVVAKYTNTLATVFDNITGTRQIRFRNGGERTLYYTSDDYTSSTWPRAGNELRCDNVSRVAATGIDFYYNLTNSTTSPAANFTLARIGNAYGAEIPGYICEIILYTNLNAKALSADAYAKLYVTYLKPKWGLP